MEGVSFIGGTPSEPAGLSSGLSEGFFLRHALHHILAEEPLR